MLSWISGSKLDGLSANTAMLQNKLLPAKFHGFERGWKETNFYFVIKKHFLERKRNINTQFDVTEQLCFLLLKVETIFQLIFQNLSQMEPQKS